MLSVHLNVLINFIRRGDMKITKSSPFKCGFCGHEEQQPFYESKNGDVKPATIVVCSKCGNFIPRRKKI
jgi:DNA-directed RNA polymerase subunit M/transcription elongation factor TFIIS